MQKRLGTHRLDNDTKHYTSTKHIDCLHALIIKYVTYSTTAMGDLPAASLIY